MTEDIINTGMIYVFGRIENVLEPGDFDVYGLPIVFGASRQQTYYFRAEAAGELDIVVAANQPGDSAGTPFFDDYRYVIIPGGVAVNNGGGIIVIGGVKTSVSDLKNMSYQQMKETFNIPE